MIFARERYSEPLIIEMRPLWQKHHDETAAFKDIELNPNIHIYKESDKNGILRIYTVRRGTYLVGYQVFFVSPHPHTQQSLQAVQDILFIEKEARLGLVGYRFVQWCCAQLKTEGVDVMFQHISARYDFGHLLERAGFELVDLVYGRRLNKALEK